MSQDRTESISNIGNRVGKLLVVTFISQIIVATAMVVLDQPDEDGDKYLSLAELIILTNLLVAIFYTIPTVGLLSFLSYTKILPSASTSKVVQFAIAGLVLVARQCVGAAVRLIPKDILFVKTPTSEGVRDCFLDPYLMFYGYILVFIVVCLYALIRRLTRKKQVAG